MLSRLSPESFERFKRETPEEAAAFRTDRGLWLDATALIGVGVRDLVRQPRDEIRSRAAPAQCPQPLKTAIVCLDTPFG